MLFHSIVVNTQWNICGVGLDKLDSEFLISNPKTKVLKQKWHKGENKTTLCFFCASGAERWNMISCLCQCYVWFIQSLSTCRSLRNFVEPQQSMEKGKPISSSFIWSYLGCPTDPQSWKQKTSNDSNESNENVSSPKQLQIRPHCWRCMLNNSQMLEGLKICLWVMCVCSNLSYKYA